MDTSTEHWPYIAGRWQQLGPPLRPSGEDLAFCLTQIHDAWLRWAPRVLILGVTPELYRLPWPPGSDLLAMDHTRAMIDAVWPGPPAAALCADWIDMPVSPASRDLVLCDGGIVLLEFPDQHRRFVDALQRALSPGGKCVLRLLVPPEEPETPAAVLEDLLAGKIANPNILKLRLGMALQRDSTQGVRLGDVWRTLHQAVPDLGALAKKWGYLAEPFQAIETYRNCGGRYHFLTVVEVCRLFCENPGGFDFEHIHSPAYELGERCPTVVFRRHMQSQIQIAAA